MKNHYTYIITNTINDKKYYGVRSCETEIQLDEYFGSSKYLDRDIKNLGIEVFIKSIDKTFVSRKEAEIYEKNYIKNNNLVIDTNWYNEKEPGVGFNTCGKVVVTDGKTNFVVSVDDPEYLDGTLQSANKGKVHHTKGKTWEEISGEEKGKKRREKHSKNLTGSGNPMSNIPHTDEWKQAHSKRMSGCGNSRYNVKLLKSTKDKISKANLKYQYMYKKTSDDNWTLTTNQEIQQLFKIKEPTVYKYTSKNIKKIFNGIEYEFSRIKTKV